LLEALGVSYECVGLEFGDDPEKGVKSQKYLNICPNGRVPAIVDHDNNDLVVWEVSLSDYSFFLPLKR
jgi:glutathione S-transferase